ncbi:MAG: hypothetical protein QNI98_00715 [Woeseiaceae bacterium]|nr:hypothetical protein [Woeseiaceae bacterium]
MSEKIRLEDFAALANTIKPILENHDIPEQYHYSIISDVIFEFANLVDTKTGTSFHESIYALLEEQAEALSTAGAARIPVTEVEIEFGNGDILEANVPDTQLEDETQMRLQLEFTLTLRDIDEIDKDIDVARRFSDMIASKKGVRELRILPGKEPDANAWVTVDAFEESMDELIACVRKVAG